jgi:GntR family transcriptional regulator
MDHHSPVPLYQQIIDVLFAKIKQGNLKPGDNLPSEAELRAEFHVSRSVIRQAIESMSRQGLIYTQQGRGSFVSPPRIDKPLDVLQSYHHSMRRSGFQVEVKILTKELVHPPQDIKDSLQLPTDRKALYLQRVGYLDGLPANILISYLKPGPWGSEESLLGFPGGSLYDYLAEELHVRLVRSRGFMQVIFAGETESQLLNLPRGSILLDISSVVCIESGAPIEYSRVVYPGNKFRFYFESFITDQVDTNDQQVPMLSPFKR